MDMQLVHTVIEGAYLPEYQRTSIDKPKTPLVAYKNAKADLVNSFTLKYVRELLTMTQGNVSEAARISGLSRVALQKILLRMGENAAIFRVRVTS